MNAIVSLIAGTVFGLGLVLSGMTNPAKVQNFLDIFGTWDPSLAFVMAGAIAVAFPTFKFSSRMTRPVFSSSFSAPLKQEIDRPLLFGSILFGTGWAMAGLCPGPAIASLSGSMEEILLFIAFMIAGMVLMKTYRSNPNIFVVQ